MQKSEVITKIIDGNEACADVAYRLSEISAIYPITPSSPMGEHADKWAANGRRNIWDFVPEVVELQSEAGASGTLHGALQTGALATTYTASQGLLLMLPNMYKIAGELTSGVMHVASRSLACQALSIFGDHSDVMAVRSAGWVMLSSGSVQEAHDMAAISHAATLECRLPFLHFFEGFRVSHEINRINILSDDDLRSLINNELVIAHRKRALNPDDPFIRGTSQNPDVYFQARETVNTFYLNTPGIVQDVMDRFAKLTGRKYNLMDYFGDPNAESVIIALGSGALITRETVDFLNQQGAKVGVLQVRLFRPFASDYLLKLLPKSVRSIAVLDRTKESNDLGEPLYSDVVTCMMEASAAGKLDFVNGMPKIIGGRYGLSSKEFTPGMVQAVFTELKKEQPKNHFTVGINDDVTFTSLDQVEHLNICDSGVKQALFFGLGSDGTVSANKNSIKIIGNTTDLYTQGYFVYDSKKSGSYTISHLRFGPNPIVAPYLIEQADFVACHQFHFLSKFDVLSRAKPGAIFLLNTPFAQDKVWSTLNKEVQEQIIAKKLKFYVIDGYRVARAAGLQGRINTVMQVCFFKLANIIPIETAIEEIKAAVKKSYGHKGADIITKNDKAIDNALENLHAVEVPEEISSDAQAMAPAVSANAPEFVKEVTVPMLRNCGDELRVSQLPADGTYPCGTTKWEKRNVSNFVASWNPEMCLQCGQCAFICPHAVIRAKRYDEEVLDKAPEGFKFAKVRGKDGEVFTLQISLEDCTGCGLCNVVCPAKDKQNPSIKAIMLAAKEPVLEREKKSVEFFNSIPYVDRSTLNTGSLRDVQMLEPLFEFSGACAGCGETPYLSLLTRLYGDHLLVANATGCSSIYGGNLPTTPWSCNKDGQGPAWSNSLFEDNAEFGFGFRLTLDQQRKQAVQLVQELSSKLKPELADEIVANMENGEPQGLVEQRERIKSLRDELSKISDEKASTLNSLAESLIKRSVWIVGGDGWAYDIGYGGLDHVIAQNRKIRVLVLDTEVYSNTGGQASKATPMGAIAKFAAAGKGTPRKDLGMMMMAYGNVYVAQVALGANPLQALRAFREAEAYEGASIILAYSHCIAHGYNLNKGVAQQKSAVETGFWPLYRYNPALREQGKNPLQIDSKGPSKPLSDFMYQEPRFKSLLTKNEERANELLKESEETIKERWTELEKLASDDRV